MIERRRTIRRQAGTISHGTKWRPVKLIRGTRYYDADLWKPERRAWPPGTERRET